MVEQGLFERFPCDLVFGLHNMPGLATDQMAVVAGPQLASSDSWWVTFRGTGTHGAKPHLGRDPITAAGQFLSALQSIPGREVDPLQPSVVSACALAAGDPKALNVIPDFARIGGTARAYTPEVRDQLEAAIGRMARGVAMAMGLDAEYEFIPAHSTRGQRTGCYQDCIGRGARGLSRRAHRVRPVDGRR